MFIRVFLSLSQVTPTNSHRSASPGVTCATLHPPTSQPDPLTMTPTLAMALQSAPTRLPTLALPSPTLHLHTMTPGVATAPTLALRLPTSLTPLKGTT